MAKETTLGGWAFGVRHTSEQAYDQETGEALFETPDGGADERPVLADYHTLIFSDVQARVMPSQPVDAISCKLDARARAMLVYNMLGDIMLAPEGVGVPGTGASDGTLQLSETWQSDVQLLLRDAHDAVLAQHEAGLEAERGMAARVAGLQVVGDTGQGGLQLPPGAGA